MAIKLMLRIKDTLFSELESTNARAKDRSETVELKVYQVGDQDSILMK